MIKLAGLVSDKRIVVKEADETSSQLSVQDMTYFKEQVTNLLNSLDDSHQEMGSQLEMAADETGVDMYKQMEAQVSRYFEASKKSLEYLNKYLDKMTKRVSTLQTPMEASPAVRPASVSTSHPNEI
jgi:hypothetical protein